MSALAWDLFVLFGLVALVVIGSAWFENYCDKDD